MYPLKRLAFPALWFVLWMAIPATLLYPLAIWMARHTQISGNAVGQIYIFAICLLFFPTGFLVDYIYRRFIRGRRNQPAEVEARPNLNNS